jgi:hypothetical protein
VGIISNPLEDVYTNCHACHPDEYWQRAAVFAAESNVTPASRATPTPVPTSDPVSREPNIEVLPPAEPAPLVPIPQALALVSAGLMNTITFLGSSYLTHRLTIH